MMDINIILSIILVICIILLLRCYESRKEMFSLSRKPMETEWNLLQFSPIDDIDYINPVFHKLSSANYVPLD
jgi:hypothetical protein